MPPGLWNPLATLPGQLPRLPTQRPTALSCCEQTRRHGRTTPDDVRRCDRVSAGCACGKRESHRKTDSLEPCEHLLLHAAQQDDSPRRAYKKYKKAQAFKYQCFAEEERCQAFLLSSSMAGTWTGVRSPESRSLASWTASRRSVLTRWAAFFAIREGGTTRHWGDL